MTFDSKIYLKAGSGMLEKQALFELLKGNVYVLFSGVIAYTEYLFCFAFWQVSLPLGLILHGTLV